MAKTIGDLDTRLTALEAMFDERWRNHEKRFEETWATIKDELKDCTLRLQVIHDQQLTQHEEFMNEVDEKIDKKTTATNGKMWKILGFIFVAVPTLFFAIFQLAQILLTAI